jgi:hypothetical protein
MSDRATKKQKTSATSSPSETEITQLVPTWAASPDQVRDIRIPEAAKVVIKTAWTDVKWTRYLISELLLDPSWLPDDPWTVDGLSPITTRATAKSLARRLEKYIHKVHPELNGTATELFEMVIADPTASRLIQIQSAKAFEYYILLLQIQALDTTTEPTPIGGSASKFWEITKPNHDTDSDMETSTESPILGTDADVTYQGSTSPNEVAAAKRLQTAQDMAAQLAELDKYNAELTKRRAEELATIKALLDPIDPLTIEGRVNGTNNEKVIEANGKQKADQTRSDDAIENAALRELIVKLKAENKSTAPSQLAYDAYGKPLDTSPSLPVHDLSNCTFGSFTLGVPTSSRTGASCPPKLQSALQKLIDVRLNVALCWINKASSHEKFTFELDEDGEPVPKKKTYTTQEFATENELTRVLNAIVAGFRKLKPDLGGYLAHHWVPSFALLQSYYPNQLPLQVEYLQRQFDCLLDDLREKQHINVELDHQLALMLAQRIASVPSVPPTPSSTTTTPPGTGAQTPPKPQQLFTSPITSAVKNGACRNYGFGLPCAFSNCPFKHEASAKGKSTKGR